MRDEWELDNNNQNQDYPLIRLNHANNCSTEVQNVLNNYTSVHEIMK